MFQKSKFRNVFQKKKFRIYFDSHFNYLRAFLSFLKKMWGTLLSRESQFQTFTESF